MSVRAVRAQDQGPQREGRTREGLRKGTRGAVYVEFLICFMPVWVMMLGMIQIALVYTAHLVVQHAATTAVRAAVVVIPEDPQRYSGATAYNVIDGGNTSGPSPVTRFLDFLSRIGSALSSFGFGGDGGSGGTGQGAVGQTYPRRNARYDDIWQAAAMPLMAIAPQPAAIWPQAFGRHPAIVAALGSGTNDILDNPAARAAVGALVYNKAALSVTFPSAPGASSFVAQWPNPHDPTQAPMVYTRVTYLFHCAVPIAAQIMCYDPIDLTLGIPYSTIRDEFRRIGSSPSVEAIAQAIQNINTAQDRLRRNQPGVDELSIAPWWGFLSFTSFTGSRYVIIRSEAGMPLQVGYDPPAAAPAPPPPPPPPPSPPPPHTIRGCCSSHGGAASCDGAPNGTVVCSDGWRSGCSCDGTEWSFTRRPGSH